MCYGFPSIVRVRFAFVCPVSLEWGFSAIDFSFSLKWTSNAMITKLVTTIALFFTEDLVLLLVDFSIVLPEWLLYLKRRGRVGGWFVQQLASKDRVFRRVCFPNSYIKIIPLFFLEGVPSGGYICDNCYVLKLCWFFLHMGWVYSTVYSTVHLCLFTPDWFCTLKMQFLPEMNQQ